MQVSRRHHLPACCCLGPPGSNAPAVPTAAAALWFFGLTHSLTHCSNENLLVCAPTGAGKTNIAMITVLREIAAHMTHGVIQKDAFKV